MKKTFLTLIFATLFSTSAMAELNFGSQEEDDSQFKLNEDYSVIVNAPTDIDTKNVDVVNFFSYGCKSCVDVSKKLDAWKSKMPYYVKTYNSPVAPTIETSYPARIYFTLEKTGREDLNIPFLEASTDGKTDFSNMEILLSWFEGRGIKNEDFNTAFDSNEVVGKIYAGPNILKMYDISSIPAITIDGKYKINAESINKNKDNLIELVEFLTEKSAKENKILTN